MWVAAAAVPAAAAEEEEAALWVEAAPEEEEEEEAAAEPEPAEVAAAAAELEALLSPGAAAAARAGAAEAAAALSGSAGGRRLLAARPALLAALAALAAEPGGAAAAAARRCLVNAAAAAGPALLPALPALAPLARTAAGCALLANAARGAGGARRVLLALRRGAGPGAAAGLAPLLAALPAPPPPALGPLLCNLSRVPEGRRELLDRSRCCIQRLLPLTQHAEPLLRRGVVGALRNCCFEHEHHDWLLGEAVDILPFLLLPLAGPEELPEDEMEALPPELQFLPPDKRREEEPDVRRMLLEALLLLAATPGGRRTLRARGTYPVLRELHRCETEPAVLAACEKLIQVLIGDEPGPGLENLLEVAVPEELERQLQRRDRLQEQEWRRQRGRDAP